MHILINGVKLFFDVDGAKLVPDGPVMREKPTLLLLHGGPGFDHASFKPLYAPLTEHFQLIYLEHRGNGRSEGGPTDGEAGALRGRKRGIAGLGGRDAMTSYCTGSTGRPRRHRICP